MKRTIPTILLALSFATVYAFDVGQEIELDNFLNARTSANFLATTNNIALDNKKKIVLSKGTTGEVSEIKNFKKGNAGIKIKINNGPRAGQSYWIYYDSNAPRIKLASAKTHADLDLKDAKLKAVDIKPEDIKHEDLKVDLGDLGSLVPVEAIKAETTADVPATRDITEHATEVASQEVLKVKETVNETLIVTRKPGCTTEDDLTEAAKKKVREAPPVVNQADLPSDPAAVETPYTPTSALNDLNSEELKFVGKALMPGNGKNLSCVYKNSKVYVIYDNCSKKESVTDIRIINHEGEILNFYVENYDLPTKTSKMKRADYNGEWGIRYNKYPAVGPKTDMTISDMQRYLKANETSTGNYCFITNEEVKSKTSKNYCSGSFGSSTSGWIDSSTQFWNDPPPEWYTTQTKLRNLIEAGK
jgi:hypothetical protein